MRELEPLVEEAVEPLQIAKGPGPNHALTLKQRVLLLLLQRLFGESNRMMASMLALFSILSGVDTGYKSIERLYSDEEVLLALHNLHAVILRKRGVKSSDASGDGTGYSLTIKENYAAEVQKRNDGAKEAPQGKMAFVYSFKIQDTRTQLYLAYGTSLRSEKCAFDKAMRLLLRIDVEHQAGQVLQLPVLCGCLWEDEGLRHPEEKRDPERFLEMEPVSGLTEAADDGIRG